MSKTAERTIHAMPLRDLSASSGERPPVKARSLSDREAVIAVMVANGATCEDVADRLSLPTRAVESYVRDALIILELTDAEDLTYVTVAAHYNPKPAATTARP